MSKTTVTLPAQWYDRTRGKPLTDRYPCKFQVETGDDTLSLTVVDRVELICDGGINDIVLRVYRTMHGPEVVMEFPANTMNGRS